MARTEIPITVFNSAGAPVNGASVKLSFRASGADATWYPSETGGTGSTTALVTDANGRVSGWIDRGSYNASITGSGITSYTEAFESTPGGNASIDANWLPDGVVTTAKISDGQITSAKIADGAISNSDISSNAAINIAKLSRYSELLATVVTYNENETGAGITTPYASVDVASPASGHIVAFAVQWGRDVRGGAGSVYPRMEIDGAHQYSTGVNISGGKSAMIVASSSQAVATAKPLTVTFSVSVFQEPVTWKPQGHTFLAVFFKR